MKRKLKIIRNIFRLLKISLQKNLVVSMMKKLKFTLEPKITPGTLWSRLFAVSMENLQIFRSNQNMENILTRPSFSKQGIILEIRRIQIILMHGMDSGSAGRQNNKRPESKIFKEIRPTMFFHTDTHKFLYPFLRFLLEPFYLRH